MYDVTTYGDTNATGIAALGTGYIIFCIALIIGIVAMWKIFTKAGKPGWASIVPFYNLYVQFEIAEMNGWMFLLLLVPIANIIVTIVMYVKLAKAFGKSDAFAVGLIFLTFIFELILAFGSSKYVGTKNN